MTDCDRFFEALASDRLQPQDRAHAQGCTVCGPLLPEDRPVESAPTPSLDSVHRRALEVLRQTPLRPWTHEAGRLALLQGGVALAVAALLGARNWRSPGVRQEPLLLVGAVLFLVLTLGTLLALAPGRRRPRLLLALVPVVPLLLVGSGDGIHTATTGGANLSCLFTVLLTGLVPIAVGVLVLRGMAFDVGRAVALGLTAAATGLFALHWHCTDGSSPHLLVFHALPWLLLAALAIPARRALPTRSHVP
jgi:hypothetical protein